MLVLFVDGETCMIIVRELNEEVRESGGAAAVRL